MVFIHRKRFFFIFRVGDISVDASVRVYRKFIIFIFESNIGTHFHGFLFFIDRVYENKYLLVRIYYEYHDSNLCGQMGGDGK